jgi:hypothetical protein
VKTFSSASNAAASRLYFAGFSGSWVPPTICPSTSGNACSAVFSAATTVGFFDQPLSVPAFPRRKSVKVMTAVPGVDAWEVVRAVLVDDVPRAERLAGVVGHSDQHRDRLRVGDLRFELFDPGGLLGDRRSVGGVALLERLDRLVVRRECLPVLLALRGQCVSTSVVNAATSAWACVSTSAWSF